MSNKFLIILHGAIGDVTRALPLAVRIKDNLPDAHITWAIEPISKDLVLNHPAIDRVEIFDRPKGIFAYLKFIKELRKNSYDYVLDLQRHFKSGVTSYLSGGKNRLGFHRNNAKEFNWFFNNNRIPEKSNFKEEKLCFRITNT